MSTEKLFPTSESLLSTTGLDSHIKYANSSFCDISGFTLDEMVGKPHNMVRHADMPKAAFADLWSFIQRGKSWMGPVKNECKNGDYYWVNAFVTPIKNALGQVYEYQSVRTVLDRDVIERANKIYPQLCRDKTPRVLKFRTDKTLWTLSLLAILTLLSAASLFLANVILLILLPIFLLSLFATVIHFFWRKQYKEVVAEANGVFDNRLMSYLYSGNSDDIGTISLALKMRKAELNAVVGRVSDDSKTITEKAKDSSLRGNKVATILSAQKNKTEQVAAAIYQMAATVQEITQVVTGASEASQQGLNMAKDGQAVVAETVNSIQGLSTQLTEVDTAITRLIEGTKSIDKALSEISGIADQTNLLALNAAIEAARAGDKGRGFAVVAGEVRELAMRSQQSTDEISLMLGQLRSESDGAILSMGKGTQLSHNCVQLSEKTGLALTEITKEVSSIADVTLQIASAVEEQSAMAEQVNQNILAIRNMSSESETHGLEAASLSESLLDNLAQQQSLVMQFKS
ncbi:methyl-accepting chemotaxis protein [Paraglaciecola polaris]|uniref:Methyl-accepting chemotaxis protein n=1 Tax=Paraglaciecola polaris LMG 21857 TaxID=1129793 RepID=K6YRU0_9ALTE|nr:PAS domain-containing methyl-accepting chemotaxis protein [Paraglaciecola polaris]GAC35434.1 methyl-accepting chemotaxis protein [Paraglaciecola polaris LMG 21857]